jgi:Phosphotransferase enzyme family
MDGNRAERPPPRPAVGQRLAWAEAPGWLRAEVAARLGARVAEAVSQPSGFSPGAARGPPVAEPLGGSFRGWRRLAAAGPALLHGDLRADNLLLTPGRVVAVDWPRACAGAAWVDLLLLLPSVAMQGGPNPEATGCGGGPAGPDRVGPGRSPPTLG